MNMEEIDQLKRNIGNKFKTLTKRNARLEDYLEDKVSEHPVISNLIARAYEIDDYTMQPSLVWW